MTIGEIIKLYNRKLDCFDIELILAHSLKKTREFILTHPEKAITKKQETAIKKNISRRIKGEPIAYITGHKEFYGLNFIVNKSTLIPRPETEQIVELALNEISNLKFQISNLNIVDIGTGSGNIIISIAKEFNTRYKILNTKYYGIDISKEALKVARLNARKNKVDKKIKFIHGNLLSPILKVNKLTKLMPNKLIVVANLPYLSKEIYLSTPKDVKKYEPKSALYSLAGGLYHYKRLFQQIKKIHDTCYMIHATCILEFSPEQKPSLTKLITNILPSAKIIFTKDLAGKWRICKINL